MPPYLNLDFPLDVSISAHVNGSWAGLCPSCAAVRSRNPRPSGQQGTAMLHTSSGRHSELCHRQPWQDCCPATCAKGRRALDRASRPHLEKALPVCVGETAGFLGDCLPCPVSLLRWFPAPCVWLDVPGFLLPPRLPSLPQPVLLNCAWGLRNRWDSFPSWL